VPRSGGVVRSRNQLLDQHHPGASRHPSSAEEGICFFSVCQFIHTLHDRADIGIEHPEITGSDVVLFTGLNN